MSLTLAPMAKKQRGRPKGTGPIKTRFVMVATEDYLDWMVRYTEHLRRSEVSDTVREVLRQSAERDGFEPPPAR